MASKTKENIVEAYLSLLQDNEIDKITVTDLVESCSISRQTFYYHFESIEDMIKWSFEYDFNNALKKSKNCHDWMAAFHNLIPMFEKYDIIIRASINSTKLMFIQDIIGCNIYYFTGKFYRDVLHFDGQVSNKQQFLVKYTSAAITGLIFMELKHDNEFSYEKLFKEIEATFSNNK